MACNRRTRTSNMIPTNQLSRLFLKISINCLKSKVEREFWEQKKPLWKSRQLDSKKKTLPIQSASDLGIHFSWHWQLALPLASGIQRQKSTTKTEAKSQNSKDYAAIISKKKKEMKIVTDTKHRAEKQPIFKLHQSSRSCLLSPTKQDSGLWWFTWCKLAARSNIETVQQKCMAYCIFTMLFNNAVYPEEMNILVRWELGNLAAIFRHIRCLGFLGVFFHVTME